MSCAAPIRLMNRRMFVKASAFAAASTILLASGCVQSEKDGESLKRSGAADSGSRSVSSEETQANVSAPLNREFVYVTEYAGNTLAAIDVASGLVASRYAAGQNPAMMAQVGTKFYVGNSSGGELQTFDLESGSNGAIPIGVQPLGLVADGQTLYASDYFNATVYAIDAQINSVVSTFQLSNVGFHGRTDPPECCRTTPGAGRRPVCMAKASDGILYCANYGTYDIARVDLATGEELEPFDGVVGPRTMLLSPDENLIVLAGVGGEERERVSDLYIVDRKTGSCVASVPIGAGVADVCMGADEAKAYAIARDEGVLVELDARTWQELRRASLDVGISSLCVSADGRMLYVANAELGSMAAVDIDTLEVLLTVGGLANPKDIAVLM